MGNILATPPQSNYRRNLSGSNRIKSIQKLDNESIDLVYVLYLYFTLVICTIAVIYLYSVKSDGVPRFKGDRQSGRETWWQSFIRWLQTTPADRQCPSYPTISGTTENQPSSTTQPNNLCSVEKVGSNTQPDGECIQ